MNIPALTPKQAELIDNEIRLITHWLATRDGTEDQKVIYAELVYEIGMFQYLDDLGIKRG